MTAPAWTPLTEHQRQSLLQFDTCKVANAIEHLGLRLKNEGFTGPGLRPHGHPGRVLGYAVTSKVRTSDPPMKGARSFYDLGDWWHTMETRPAPRVAVIEDVDSQPGAGAVLSDMHAHVLQRLDCHAVVTNGAVRNVDTLARMHFTALAGHVAISHAYVHMVAFGCPVEIFGLPVQPLDLVYADVHGMIVLPPGEMDKLIAVLQETARAEARVTALCESGAGLAEIREAMQKL